MRTFIFSALVFVLTGNIAVAQEDDADAAVSAKENCPALQASVVFVAQKGKKGSAERLTETHEKAESQGWSFDEMSLYLENSDLQGFYVTYTRPHPCNKQQEM